MHTKLWRSKILNCHVVKFGDRFRVDVLLGTNISSFLWLLLQKIFSANFRYPPFHEWVPQFPLCKSHYFLLFLFLHIKFGRINNNCLLNLLARRVWLNSGTLEKRCMPDINTTLKFCVWNHDMPCVLEKIIIAEVSGYMSECVNVINVFHGVNLILYAVTNTYPKAGVLLECYQYFCSKNLALFTLSSIHSIQKSTKTENQKRQDER